MHARIDALTCPRFWSLLPSTILDWVVIIVSVSPSVDAPKHADTSRERYLKYFAHRPHRTDLLLVGAHEHYSGCTSLHLRKRNPHRGDTSSSRVAHITILASLGGPNRSRMARSVESIPPWLKPQVCKCVVGQDEKRYTLSYQES